MPTQNVPSGMSCEDRLAAAKSGIRYLFAREEGSRAIVRWHNSLRRSDRAWEHLAVFG